MTTGSVAPSYTQNFDTLLYRVRPGDSLSRILYRYHTGLSESQLPLLIQQVKADNPSITNPDRIKPDQLISLKIPEQYCAAPTPSHRLPTLRTDSQQWMSELERTWDRSTREERDLLSTLLPAFIGLGSAKMSMIDTAFSTNAPLMREMASNYEAYKAGQKTKGQYDYQRRKLVHRLTTNLGPTNLILNGGQRPTEILRISSNRGTVPTAPLEAQTKKMLRAAKLAKIGGVVLTGVSLGLACHEIANAKSRHDKNEIFVEAGGAAIGGIAYGIGTTAVLLLVSGPVGWVAALAIGAGSVIAGVGGGYVSKKFYNTQGNSYDFAGVTGATNICSISPSQSRRRLNSVYSNNTIMSR